MDQGVGGSHSKDGSEVDHRVVQSLDRGITALEAALGTGVKPADLAAVLKVDRSSAYRLLSTWFLRGYLIRDDASGTYSVNGIKLAELQSQVAAAHAWPQYAISLLRSLRDQTGETANLGVLNHREVLFLAQELSETSVITLNLLGRRRPAHACSLGKAILGHFPPDLQEDWVHASPLERVTPHTIVDPDRLREHLEMVRELGYAIDDEETNAGIRCIAAPVFDRHGSVVGAMGISGPNERLPMSRVPRLAQIVMDLARAASDPPLPVGRRDEVLSERDETSG